VPSAEPLIKSETLQRKDRQSAIVRGEGESVFVTDRACGTAQLLSATLVIDQAVLSLLMRVQGGCEARPEKRQEELKHQIELQCTIAKGLIGFEQ
jgi:hypothetical protein